MIQINTKPVIKSKLKELLSESKKFKIETILVLDYNKRNDSQIFHSSANLITTNLDNDEAFNSMHRSILKKIKNFATEDCIVLDEIIKHNIKIFEC